MSKTRKNLNQEESVKQAESPAQKQRREIQQKIRYVVDSYELDEEEDDIFPEFERIKKKNR